MLDLKDSAINIVLTGALLGREGDRVWMTKSSTTNHADEERRAE